jgi:trehalose 6-phosphate phosphatase
MVDYDGTLVPFCDQPSRASLAPHVRSLLTRLATIPSTTLAILSGRRLAELEDLVAPLPVHLVGEHGWDERTIEGHLILHPLPGEAAKVLGRAAHAAREWGLAEHLERKRCALTLHTRALTHEQATRIEEACRRLWGDGFQRNGLRLTRIDGGIELRALAYHEGTAVARLIRSSPPGTVPVYLGDDLPDEEAFYQLLGQGIAIRVGGDDRDSMAHYTLGGPEDVLAMLEHWNERIQRPA